MCVVALALHHFPGWPVLLVGNRDEFHARASAPLHNWDDGSGTMAGRDLVSGGTWLGINPAFGRLAVITNVRSGEAPDPDKRSRGELVCGALNGDDAILDGGSAYNGFTLLRLTGLAATLSTNRPHWSMQSLPSGLHAIANQPVGAPCDRAEAMAAALGTCDPADDDAIFAMLRAGVEREFVPGEAAAQAFLRNPVYGTRCSTLIRVDTAGHGSIVERRFDSAGAPSGETRIEFSYRAAALPQR